MICPYCHHPETKVIDSREAEESVRRRRECLKCFARFSTEEVASDHLLSPSTIKILIKKIETSQEAMGFVKDLLTRKEMLR